MTRPAVPQPAGLEPVGPAPFVAHVVRPMTRVLNPLIRKVAGHRNFAMAAQIRHVDRRSGRNYVTPTDQAGQRPDESPRRRPACRRHRPGRGRDGAG